MSAIDDAFGALTDINLQEIRSEVTNLRAIKAWSLKQLGMDFEIGDRVQIIDDQPSSVGRESGWYSYREALAVGQTGIAEEVFFNASHGIWQIDVAMDRTWSVHDRDVFTGRGYEKVYTRYWNGPASETPEGFDAPSKFDQEKWPHGKVKHFFLNVRWLAKAPASEGATA